MHTPKIPEQSCALERLALYLFEILYERDFFAGLMERNISQRRKLVSLSSFYIPQQKVFTYLFRRIGLPDPFPLGSQNNMPIIIGEFRPTDLAQQQPYLTFRSASNNRLTCPERLLVYIANPPRIGKDNPFFLPIH